MKRSTIMWLLMLAVIGLGAAGAPADSKSFRDEFVAAYPKPDWWDSVPAPAFHTKIKLQNYRIRNGLGRPLIKSSYQAVLDHPEDEDLVLEAVESIVLSDRDSLAADKLIEAALKHYSKHSDHLGYDGQYNGTTIGELAEQLAQRYNKEGRSKAVLPVVERLYRDHPTGINMHMRQLIALIEAEALYHTGHRKKAKAILEQAVTLKGDWGAAVRARLSVLGQGEGYNRGDWMDFGVSHHGGELPGPYGTAPYAPAPKVVRPAPAANGDWNLLTLDGRTVPFSHFKGKTVFLNFWATSSGPSREEMPSIERLYQKVKGKKVEIVVVSGEDPEKVKSFLANHHFTFPIYTFKLPAPADFSVNLLPVTYVVAPNGKVVFKHVDPAGWDRDGFIHHLLSFQDQKENAPTFSDLRSVPDFDGTLLTGEPFHLADHIGRDMVVLNFFTTYCGPCRADLPALSRYYDQNKTSGVVVLGIDVDENPGLVKGFAQSQAITFPILIDSGELTKALGVTGYPTTIVIGVDGKIQFRKLDPVNPETELEPLAAANRERLQKESFTAAAGQSTLHVAPTEVKPVAGYKPGAAPPNQIFDIQVVQDAPELIQVEVDYYYAGDHGDKRIYIDCDPLTAAGGAPFGMLPGAVAVGRNKVRAPLSSYYGTPNNCVSTQIQCRMESRIDLATLAEKVIPYQKTWKKTGN